MAYIANILHVSLRSIMKNKRRNIFTMIGIIIGIAAVITIMSLGNGFKRQPTNSSVMQVRRKIVLWSAFYQIILIQ